MDTYAFVNQKGGVGYVVRAEASSSSLQRRLRRRGLAVPLLEHDLVAEMRGERQRLLDRPPDA